MTKQHKQPEKQHFLIHTANMLLKKEYELLTPLGGYVVL